ncbi:MAG: four helix bundle protein [Candidatus Shapirobacteria bacterium]|jgi:four helix bundle protein|nr:four helix bundle protein [Candidatus Shapirobacteria bacterium]MDD5073641.1 four helix bundle protein [Candidatus Shapirobacteria bacterium]MDD5481398.1 four helix bundle protein [Candidatus Shapirobacteria bacterium]
MYKFEKLRVWQSAMDLVVEVYKFTKQLPKEETYGLRDQIRRASVSIALNIAEGTGDKSDKELIRYLYLSKKSLFETITGLKLTQRIYQLKPEQILKNCDNLGRSLQALINSLSKSQKLKTND